MEVHHQTIDTSAQMMVLKVRRLIIVYSRTPVTEVSVTEMILPWEVGLIKLEDWKKMKRRQRKWKYFLHSGGRVVTNFSKFYVFCVCQKNWTVIIGSKTARVLTVKTIKQNKKAHSVSVWIFFLFPLQFGF